MSRVCHVHQAICVVTLAPHALLPFPGAVSATRFYTLLLGSSLCPLVLLEVLKLEKAARIALLTDCKQPLN